MLSGIFTNTPLSTKSHSTFVHPAHTLAPVMARTQTCLLRPGVMTSDVLWFAYKARKMKGELQTLPHCSDGGQHSVPQPQEETKKVATAWTLITGPLAQSKISADIFALSYLLHCAPWIEYLSRQNQRFLCGNDTGCLKKKSL